MALRSPHVVKPVLGRAAPDIIAPSDLKNERKQIPVKGKDRDGRIPARKSVNEAGLQKFAERIARLKREAVQMIFPALACELSDEDAAACGRGRDDRDGKA